MDESVAVIDQRGMGRSKEASHKGYRGHCRVSYHGGSYESVTVHKDIGQRMIQDIRITPAMEWQVVFRVRIDVYVFSP